MLKLYFLHPICHNFDMCHSTLIILMELLNLNKAYIKTGGLLNTLKFVHKISADVIKFICSHAELVHKMQRLWFYRFFFLWFISEGCQVHALVANTDMYNFKTVNAQQTKGYKNNKKSDIKQTPSFGLTKFTEYHFGYQNINLTAFQYEPLSKPRKLQSPHPMD